MRQRFLLPFWLTNGLVFLGGGFVAQPALRRGRLRDSGAGVPEGDRCRCPRPPAGRARIEPWVPIFLFAILFGLSMDYHVFLLSRIRERFNETGNNREAVAYGITSTARIITGAALIMVAVFAGFALGDLVPFQHARLRPGPSPSCSTPPSSARCSSPRACGCWERGNWYLPRWLRWLPELSVEAWPGACRNRRSPRRRRSRRFPESRPAARPPGRPGEAEGHASAACRKARARRRCPGAARIRNGWENSSRLPLPTAGSRLTMNRMRSSSTPQSAARGLLPTPFPSYRATMRASSGCSSVCSTSGNFVAGASSGTCAPSFSSP